MFSFVIVRVCFFSYIWERNIVSSSCIKSGIEKSEYLKTVFPASILLISRTSLMIPNRCCDEVSILSAYSITLPLSPASCLIKDVIPTIAFIGVRISWDILARKLLFDLFASCATWKASSAACFACRSFVFTVSSLALFSRSTRIASCWFLRITKEIPSITQTATITVKITINTITKLTSFNVFVATYSAGTRKISVHSAFSILFNP